MPATLPTDFKTALKGTVALSNALRIVRSDGEVFAFTDADWDTTLPALTIGGLTVPETTYKAGLCEFPVTHEADEDITNADSWEFVAYADGSYLLLPDAEKQLFRGAEAIWIIYERKNLTWQKIQTRCFLGEHDLTGFRMVWKMKGLSHPLQQDAGEVTSPLSRANWGDPELAFFDLTSDTADGYAARVTGAVTAVNSTYPRRKFTLPGTIGFPSGRFTDGTVLWTGGANSGMMGTVLEFDHTTGTFTLDAPAYHPITVGDTLRAQISEPRTFEDWMLYFNDGMYFAGETGIPTIESSNQTTP